MGGLQWFGVVCGGLWWFAVIRWSPNGSGTKVSQTGSDKNKFISGLKFVSININSIRGKKLELLAFLDFHQPQIVAIQETKIDCSILTSELFPESCP